MQVIETLSDLRTLRTGWYGTVGLVPTMGYLHAGHLALVERAKNENQLVVVSIFVNPTQFAPNEDLSRYPRDLARDLALLEGTGADVVWVPSVAEMYPTGYQTWVDVSEVTRHLEGKSRPGHFRGVATVVSKLFHQVQPTRAYFGKKDAQQTVVIRQMVRDLDFPVTVVLCPTVREADGLALSSRNKYLSAAERQAATVLFRALSGAKAAYDGGERNGDVLRALMSETLAQEPLAREEYVSVADLATLEEVQQAEGAILLSMAVRFGNTRLIDNFRLGESEAA